MTHLLVAATGGHLSQLVQLSPRIADEADTLFVTFDSPQSRSLLAGRRHFFIPSVEERDMRGVLRAALIANRLYRHHPIKAVVSTGAEFNSAAEMRQWINNLDPSQAYDEAWPSPESRPAWELFSLHARRARLRQWRRRNEDIDDVTWYGDVPPTKAWLRVTDLGTDAVQIWSTGFDLLGEASVQINPGRSGILRAQRLAGSPGIRLLYRGPRDLFPPASKGSPSRD